METEGETGGMGMLYFAAVRGVYKPGPGPRDDDDGDEPGGEPCDECEV